jgi:hypothetical protein
LSQLEDAFGDPDVPLSTLLLTAALLLAVPTGFLLLLLSFGAVGPWRGSPQVVTLPDLADDLLAAA